MLKLLSVLSSWLRKAPPHCMYPYHYMYARPTGALRRRYMRCPACQRFAG